eukprot:scaffold360_cov374-Pavlova_lutheri.AAC.73
MRVAPSTPRPRPGAPVVSLRPRLYGLAWGGEGRGWGPIRLHRVPVGPMDDESTTAKNRTKKAWKKSAKDGRTTYVLPHPSVAARGGNAVLEVDEAVAQEVVSVGRPSDTMMEQDKQRRARVDENVADVVREDAEFLPGGEGQVLLRIEYMTQEEIKRSVAFVHLALFASLGCIVAFHVYATRRGNEVLVDMQFQYASIGIAGACFVILVSVLLRQILVWNELKRRKLVWADRQIKQFRIAVFCYLLSISSSVAYVTRAAYSVSKGCNSPSTLSSITVYINWLILFTFMLIFTDLAFRHILVKRGNGYAVQAHPFAYRWAHLLLYAAISAIVTALLVVSLVRYNENNGKSWEETCDLVKEGAFVSCGDTTAVLRLQNAMVAMVAAFFSLFVLYILLAWLRLRRCSWLDHRDKNVTLRYLFLHTLTVYMVFFVAVAVSVWGSVDDCERIVSFYAGLLGDILSIAAWSVVYGYMFTPKSGVGGQHHFRQSVLMKFLWAECGIGSEIYYCDNLSTRTIDIGYGPKKTLEHQPVFVFETAGNLLLFSSLVYLDERSSREEFDIALRTAMSAYDLKEHKVFHDPVLQVRAIVAWSSKEIVVVFRGTKERANITSDIMAWRTAHPRMPCSGGTALNRWWKKPLIHYGFWRSFASNNIGDHVVRLVYSLVVAGQGNLNVRLTGHSLGGALAILCAYEVARGCKSFLSTNQIMCYTFGAPRVGNKYAAREFERLVPDLWNVVNNVDVVVFSGKLFALYSHPGLRVLIDSKGDILVRPSVLEVALRHFFFTERLRDHLLRNYFYSMLEVCKRRPVLRNSLMQKGRAFPKFRKVFLYIDKSDLMNTQFASDTGSEFEEDSEDEDIV